jgi:hypothetical protein
VGWLGLFASCPQLTHFFQVTYHPYRTFFQDVLKQAVISTKTPILCGNYDF